MFKEPKNIKTKIYKSKYQHNNNITMEKVEKKTKIRKFEEKLSGYTNKLKNLKNIKVRKQYKS